jgi:transcriptional regulator with XRE-family HTH domain
MVHEQLRLARERKGFTLAALARRTGVRERLLESLERGDFAELPSGLYGRQVVRAYAKDVGLDAEAILSEVAPSLPEMEDPLDGLARVHGCPRRRQAPAAEATAVEERPSGPTDPVAQVATAAIDVALLATIALALLALTAAVLDIGLEMAAREASAAMVPLVASIVAWYYVLLGGIRGETVGSQLIAGDRRAAHRIETLRPSASRDR